VLLDDLFLDREEFVVPGGLPEVHYLVVDPVGFQSRDSHGSSSFTS
jgi:hypothetical protein